MIALVSGKREQGKSTLALYLALQWSPRVLVFDPRRQFFAGTVTSDLDELEELLDSTPGVIIFQPVGEDDNEEFIPIAESMLARGFESQPDQRFVLLVDEAQDLAKYGQSMKVLSKFARKTKTDTAALVMTFHRPVDVHTDFRSLPTDMYYFRTTLANDLEVVSWNAPEEVVELVKHLPLHHFVHVEVDKDVYEVIDKPETWYVPIGEPAYA